MRFSIVIPSYLGPYAGAARQREEKLPRAIQSCLNQTFTDFEVHVVCDGCDKSFEIASKFTDPRIHVWKIHHRKLWSGYPRNKGIDEAKGEYIIYLDIDDVYGQNHLEIVDSGLDGMDWVWYNDIRYKPTHDGWFENDCDINVLSRHGTSNICHKTSLRMRWEEDGKYAHDYVFVQKLLTNPNYKKIATPEYYVCHVPGTGLSGGYDL
jgi:glycosyltransferase involved in cell wall biosynthesis